MAWTIVLADKASDAEIADLSEFCLTKKISPRLSRPAGVAITLPGDTPAIRGTTYDGRPALEVGTRVLKAYQDGVLRANNAVWNISPTGDENSTSIMVTAWDALMYTRKRPVRDADGSFANPSFPSPISGAEILQLALQNTISNTGPPGDHDGPLPIDLTGAIASSTDLAADLTNWPVSIADLISTLTATGGLDVGMLPVDTHSGFPAGIIGQFIAADRIGSDLTGSVNFDYATGDFSIANIRRSFDLDELVNKLYYYLGPRVHTATDPDGSSHYTGNITATEAGLSAYLALELASRALYDTFFQASIYDDTDSEASARKLFHALWKQEVRIRAKPRELLYVTPAAGAGCPFRPFIDYGVGDTVTVNASDIVGPALVGATQRIYGFDVDEGQDGVERVSEFIVSAQDE